MKASFEEVNVKALDRLKNSSGVFDDACRIFLKTFGLATLEPSKRLAPVLTGTLRRSITSENPSKSGSEWSTKVKSDRTIVNTDVGYAVYQEFGTRYIKPKFFMRGGIETVANQIETVFKEVDRVIQSKL